MSIIFHIFVVLIGFNMTTKENTKVPGATAILTSCVETDKPFAEGTSYLIDMRKGQGLKGSRNPMYRHGMEGTKVYWAWTAMKQRVSNPNSENFLYYGGRGITICKEWKDSMLFIKWALSHGYKEGLFLDRIDNNKGYYPKNCRWVTSKESNRNKRRSEMYGITKVGNSYGIHIYKNGHTYYGGSSMDLQIAKELREILINELKELP
jgi:hypothetical protein